MNLEDMPNIGKEMSHKLHEIGIHTADTLIAVGSKDAYKQLKAVWPNVCLVHLQTLQAAIEGIPFNTLKQDTKEDLKAFDRSLK